MRLFHISDLHIGKILHEVNLLEDQRELLRQVVELADTYVPDGVLICGDIYDKAVPSAEAVKVFDTFLSAFAKREIPVFLISGNHDSPERIHFASEILGKSRIFVKGVFDGKLDPVELVGACGERVRIYLLPFLKPFDVRAYYAETQIDSYDRAVREVIAHADIDERAVNILLAHQFVTGAVRAESESVMVGGLDNIGADAFDVFDYVALGHLHRPQKVGRETVRYCGTLMPYSFDANEGEKSVTMVELSQTDAVQTCGKRPDEENAETCAKQLRVNVRTLPVYPRRGLLTVRGNLEELLKAESSEDYVKAVLTDEEEVVDAVWKLRSVYPNLLTVEFESRRRMALAGVQSAGEIAGKTPEELFADFYEEQNGAALSGEDRELLRTIVDEMI